MSTHLLSVTALHKSYQSRALLQDVTFGLDRGMRVGIIGDNGSGKSTLLKCLAGVDTVDSGHIALRQGTEVAYLPQVPELGSGPVQAVLEAPFATLVRTIADYESSLARGAQPPDDTLETIERLGGWNVQHRIDQVARDLGVESLTALCHQLSGGQKKRVALAQLVLRDPDLILLDEPTNHLDTDTVAWLETWLRQSRGAALVVTHDRAFLDAIAHHMAELHNGQLRMYPGNYADFLEARAALDAVDERTVSRRAQVIKTELEWARRGPKARTTKSQARLDRLDDTIAQQQAAPSTRRVADINFGHAPRLGNTILELDEATVSYGSGPIFAPLTFKLVAKERWGIIGPNGAGKTSFLRMVAQELPVSGGQATYGVNTKIAYFDQHRVSLPPTAAVREVLVPEGGDTVFVQGKPVHVASYLQRFAFSAGYGQMRVEQLSGGEKNRLALARFLLQEANLLLLDEPTNDLDLVTLNVLETALLSFSGCVLVVSHDRRFLDKTATGIMAFDPQPNGQVAVSMHQGGFTEYQRERANARAPSVAAPVQPVAVPTQKPTVGRKLSWAEKRELEGIMARIEESEQHQASLQAQLADPALWSRDPEHGKQLQLELETSQETTSQLYKRWEALSERAGN